MIELADIEAARDRIAGAAVRTPLVRLHVDEAPAEIGGEHAQHLTVDVVDGRRREQQCTDPPSVCPNMCRLHGGVAFSSLEALSRKRC